MLPKSLPSPLREGGFAFAPTRREAPARARLAVATSLVFGLGFGLCLLRAFESVWLAIVLLVPFVARTQGQPLGRASAHGFAYSLGAGLGSGIWVPQALRFLGSTDAEALLGLGLAIGWSATPGLLAQAAALARVRARASSIRLASVGGIVFVVEQADYYRPGAVPWTLLGHTATDAPGLAQLAAVGGVPLVSATLAVAAAALVELTRRHPPRGARVVPAALLAALLVLAATGERVAESGLEAIASDGRAGATRYLAIQPQVPRLERIEPRLQPEILDRLTRYARGAVGEIGNDRVILVWPENALQTGGPAPPLARTAREIGRRMGLRSVMGLARRADSGAPAPITSSIAWLDPQGAVLDLVDKHVAVPVIESRSRSPLESLAARSVGAAGRWDKVRPTTSIQPLGAGSRAAVTLCFEILHPQVVAARRPARAEILLNLADDSWTASEWADRQLTGIARFRAIETRLPLLRVSHGGRTASFDALGRPRGALPVDRFGSLEIAVRRATQTSWLLEASIVWWPTATGLAVGGAVRAYAPTRIAPRKSRLPSGTPFDRRMS